MLPGTFAYVSAGTVGRALVESGAEGSATSGLLQVESTVAASIPSTSHLRCLQIFHSMYQIYGGWFGVCWGPAGGLLMGGLVPAKVLLTTYPKYYVY